MSEIKLAKCPFCDAKLKRWDYMPNVFFEHPYNGCILSGKKVLESEHDVKAWNTRKPMERIKARIDEKMESVDYWTKPYDKYEYYDNGYWEGMNEIATMVKEEGGIE